jgi:HlyD family secretion protein
MNDIPVSQRAKADVGPISQITPTRQWLRSPFAIVGLVLLIALLWGGIGHWQRDRAAAEIQRQTIGFIPNVHVAEAKLDSGPIKLSLPGNTEAFDSAILYARATGYIAERDVDIGDRVHAGDLLAKIAAPDLDQQLAQASEQLAAADAQKQQSRANVEQSRSSAQLASVTNDRSAALVRQGWVTQEQADTDRLGLAGKHASLAGAVAGASMDEASYKAQQATVARLQQLTAYERVTAPFDGVITSRNIDVGDLATSDGNGATGNTLFTIAHDDVLRVQVDVPQSGAVGVHDGLAATVRIPEIPDHIFSGTVSRSTVALNPTSRALHIEVDIQNPDKLLRPGLYVEVELAVPRITSAVIVPAEAIIFNGRGLHVATIDYDGNVRMREVTIYRDFGTTVELRGGLNGGEQVITNPPAGLEDGAAVHVAQDQLAAQQS